MPITRVLQIDPRRPDPEHLALAAACLRAGGLVAFPTETVYGLGAAALDGAAAARIFAAKGRPATDPLIVHLQDTDQLAEVAAEIPDLARRLAAAFWPGPLTLVVPRGPRVPEIVTAGRPTVAVRVPAHPVALGLLAAAGAPIAAPSANRFARPSPTTAQHVLDDLEGAVDLVLDAGPVLIGLESTIVDVTQQPPAVLRPGGLALEALRRLAPEIVTQTRYAATTEAAAAPGQFLKHYSPRAELRLVDGPRRPALNALRAAVRAAQSAGQRAGLLLLDEDRRELDAVGAETAGLGPGADLEAVGRRLFAAMRELDSRGVDLILARLPEPAGLGLAIRDRLYRAAEGRVLNVPADGEP